MSTNAVELKSSSRISTWGKSIHCDKEISTPPLKLRHFFTHNIHKNRHMKYNIHVRKKCLEILKKAWLQKLH